MPIGRYQHRNRKGHSMSNLRNEIRGAQFLSVFGVGSIMDVDQQSLMVCSPDQWCFWRNDRLVIDPNRYAELPKINEVSLLLKRLNEDGYANVESLYLLPSAESEGCERTKNAKEKLQVAAVRFPLWMYCPKCHKLNDYADWRMRWKQNIENQNGIDRDARNRLLCRFEKAPMCYYCRGDRLRGIPRLIPMSIVTVCEHGHIADFPWRTWCGCTNPDHELEFHSSGDDLSRQKVCCPECKKGRSLFGVFDKKAMEELQYRCPGTMPWKGYRGGVNNNPHEPFDFQPCGIIPRVVQKNGTNVYFPRSLSVISLPRQDLMDFNAVVSTQTFPALEALVQRIGQFDVTNQRIMMLIEMITEEAQALALSENRVISALRMRFDVDHDMEEWEYDKNEFWAMKDAQSDDTVYFEVVRQKMEEGGWFDYVNKVSRMREVSVLTEFTRLYASSRHEGDAQDDNQQDDAINREAHPQDENNDQDVQVRPQKIANRDTNWLPACEGFGEGIFVSVSVEHLKAWYEENEGKLHEEYEKLIRGVHRDDADEKEQVLRTVLHTLSHCMMVQMAVDSGYSLTALKEKIYCSTRNGEGNEFYGILIYTTSPDKCGTLGGLVRYGDEDDFISMLTNALLYAEHCSSDPLCSENSFGAGSRASCFACTFLPETSCSMFNRWLDRLWLRNDPTKNRPWKGAFDGEVEAHVVFNPVQENSNHGSDLSLSTSEADNVPVVANLRASFEDDALCENDYENIWQDLDDCSESLRGRLTMSAPQFNAKERPYRDASFSVNDMPIVWSQLAWKNSKVALFSEDNAEACEQLNGVNGWKAFLLSDQLDVVTLLNALKEK